MGKRTSWFKKKGGDGGDGVVCARPFHEAEDRMMDRECAAAESTAATDADAGNNGTATTAATAALNPFKRAANRVAAKTK